MSTFTCGGARARYCQINTCAHAQLSAFELRVYVNTRFRVTIARSVHAAAVAARPRPATRASNRPSVWLSMRSLRAWSPGLGLLGGPVEAQAGASASQCVARRGYAHRMPARVCKNIYQ